MRSRKRMLPIDRYADDARWSTHGSTIAGVPPEVRAVPRSSVDTSSTGLYVYDVVLVALG